MKRFLYTLIGLLLISCEEEISVDLPPAEVKLVVDGFIEPGLPPVITLTESRGFFEPADSASLAGIVVKDAEVFVHDGQVNHPLQFFQSGIYGLYTGNFTGEVGKKYDLLIRWKGKEYTSTTTIPEPVVLDSLWFQVESPGDSLGFIWASMQEPAGTGDFYRWFAMRQGKDPYPIAPLGSVFDDKFVDGKEIRFGYHRGNQTNSAAADDNNRERGYFKMGDTVLVRFCTIDADVYKFIFSFEVEAANGGNPFAAPTTVKTNIEGGALGYWGGYGASYHTMICK